MDKNSKFSTSSPQENLNKKIPLPYGRGCDILYMPRTSNPVLDWQGGRGLVMSNILLSFVVGIISGLIANWLYDKTRRRG